MQPQNTTWEDLKIVADLRLLILQDTPVPLDHHVKEKSNVVPHRSFFHLWPQTEVQKEGSSVLEILYIDLPCSSGFFAFFYFVLIALSLVGFWPSAHSHSASVWLKVCFFFWGRLGRGGKKRIYFFVLGIWLDIPWTGAAQDINTLTKLLCLLFKKIKLSCLSDLAVHAYMIYVRERLGGGGCALLTCLLAVFLVFYDVLRWPRLEGNGVRAAIWRRGEWDYTMRCKLPCACNRMEEWVGAVDIYLSASPGICDFVLCGGFFGVGNTNLLCCGVWEIDTCGWL